MRKTVSVRKTLVANRKTRVSSSLRKGEIPVTTPAGNQNQDRLNKHSLHAADLFSRFTADIIKKDVVFTR